MTNAPVPPPKPTRSAVPSPPPGQPPTAAPRPSRALWLGVGFWVLGSAGLGYTFTGAPQAVGRTATEGVSNQGGTNPSSSGQDVQGITRGQVEAAVSQLAKHLLSRPDDAEGWFMLGRAQMMLGRLPQALVAYERLHRLRPDDADGLVDYAEALAATDGRLLQGESLHLIERALKLAPDHLKALVLAGSAAFDRHDDVKAVQYWDRAAGMGPADEQLVQMARDGAAAARRRSKLQAPPPTRATRPVAAAASAVSGTVRLSPTLKALASPEDLVYIFARPADGAHRPLAVVRKRVKDLPAPFTLDDSSSMSPAARLSGAQRVVVGARISRSGQAMPQRGDLQGSSPPVSVGTTGLVVDISTLVP